MARDEVTKLSAAVRELSADNAAMHHKVDELNAANTALQAKLSDMASDITAPKGEVNVQLPLSAVPTAVIEAVNALQDGVATKVCSAA